MLPIGRRAQALCKSCRACTFILLERMYAHQLLQQPAHADWLCFLSRAVQSDKA